MSYRVATLAGALAAEIARVAALRERYTETQRACPHAACGPAIFLMTVSLDRAIAAADSPAIEGQAAALSDLRGYTG